MKVSLNPTYFCNFDCSFCYLTKEQLRDPKIIRTDLLDSRLEELSARFGIDVVDLYGGEVGLLKRNQFDEIRSVIRKYTSAKINIITNLSRVPDWFADDDIDISVSYDFDVRQAQASVRNNMATLPKEFSILILASKQMLTKDVDAMISELNMYRNLISIEIKPYSTNQANADDVTFRDFEEFVRKWIESPVEKHFEFVNQFLIEEAIFGYNNRAFSDDHIYITPNGKFGVLEFDDNDNEFFMEIDSLDEYEKWTLREYQRVQANVFCGACEYFGKCLSEHLREVKSLDKSCNGFKGLLDWYRHEKMES